MSAVHQFSAAQARRIALAAQGFGRPRPAPGAVTGRHLQRVIDTVGVIQIDSVNVLSRSHYLPFYSRLGAYDQGLLDRMRDRAPRRLVEYWAHEASLISPSTWPLLDFRMQRAANDSWGSMQSIVRQQPELVDAVRAEVLSRGPLTSRDVESALEHDRPRAASNWGWNWSAVKTALEYLFWSGQVVSAGRTAQFERRYASIERTFAPAARASARPQCRPAEQDALRELMRISLVAQGIGTEQCLRDYFRLRPDQARPALQRLVAEGVAEPATIQGWKRPAYLHAGAKRPRTIAARALLSPFDSLIWQRERTSALFGFDYRLEIYTPAPKRVHGYYVLPFLHGDRLVARCDLKADRAAGRLLVQRTTWEPGATAADRQALVEELDLMAQWLGLHGGVQHFGAGPA